MPHVTVEMLPGRTKEVKHNLAEQLSQTVAACVNVDPSDVSVSIREVSIENWKAEVYNRVLSEESTIYRRPKEM